MRLIYALFLSIFAVTSYAEDSNLVLGSSVSKISFDETKLDTLVISIGYENKLKNNFSITPEIKLGTGLGDDNSNDETTKLERFASSGIRLQHDVTEQFFVYLSPTFANFKISSSSTERLLKRSTSHLGVGFGLGYQVDDSILIDGSIEEFGEFDLFQVGLKVSF
ncbi:outer membrane beta-barrel protein [Vibrio nigripulchritudo]|uniref:outer membrane beta-barrel protein n=1 Tax=Vibrio nigripulchritudo TaxID=28173 RepID=UPI002493C695|nr:outer membrane beta-barrel protein [Vibrio nigripulchritudo]BDU35914.1 hypothetical protein TUMSATVNIG2_03830 [Vibrio nigripulchritudo]BDU41586.1 hypothetical protein TUMSATVNIG3_03840 [Vibrio nigripulchritudo]